MHRALPVRKRAYNAAAFLWGKNQLFAGFAFIKRQAFIFWNLNLFLCSAFQAGEDCLSHFS